MKIELVNPFKGMTAVQVAALGLVAATSAFFGYLAYWLIETLASPGWCAKAIQAERITPGNAFQGLIGCLDLLKLQVGVLGKALLIVIGTFALCLGVLVVIVLAGAKLAGSILGNNVNVERDK